MITLLYPALVSAALGLFGLAVNWVFNLVEWNIAVIGIIVLTTCTAIALVSSVWARIVITVALALTTYVHGALDRQAQLAVKHKAEVADIHNTYRQAAAVERQRQQQVNQQAQQDAAAEKERQDAEIASLQKQNELLREKAMRDVHAKRPAFSIDAVQRLNAVRLRRKPVPGS